ncbi:hypothetical protein CR969_01610 [Candidatus Saccharibacteria bacterium]|nr:MAG: hypothetical protein CR969_01610 [Candidatus Saccharibacteria bacterium]
MIKKILKSKKSTEKKELPSRITNDTVAQHREKVLAGGRKHKYPLQYTKHKLVWNTIFISVAGLILVSTLVWLQLYVWKDTSDLAYRITRVLPLPIAKIDGQSVPYSNYLLYHRSSIAALKVQGQDEIAADKAAFLRQQAMDRALEVAYANKIANERDIKVNDNQVDDFLKKQRESTSLTESSWESAVRDHLGWSLSEQRQAVRSALTVSAVAFSVDEPASNSAKQVRDYINKKKSLAEIAKSMKDKVQLVPDITVPKKNTDSIAAIAAKLKPGQISPSTKTLAGDGYYFISLKSTNDNTLTYSYLKVPLTVFKQQLIQVKESDKVAYYVDVKQ